MKSLYVALLLTVGCGSTTMRDVDTQNADLGFRFTLTP
jgi:hypothetical protein